MRRIILVLALTLSVSAIMLFPYHEAMCDDAKCCNRCMEKYSSCMDKYEKQLYSNCHNTCGKAYPGKSEEYNSCLDECYDDAAAELESGGDGICEDQYEGCKAKCGGCPDSDDDEG